jgi:hypothetical protein
MLQPWWRIVLLKRSRGEHYLVTTTCSLATLQQLERSVNQRLRKGLQARKAA